MPVMTSDPQCVNLIASSRNYYSLYEGSKRAVGMHDSRRQAGLPAGARAACSGAAGNICAQVRLRSIHCQRLLPPLEADGLPFLLCRYVRLTAPATLHIRKRHLNI